MSFEGLIQAAIEQRQAEAKAKEEAARQQEVAFRKAGLEAIRRELQLPEGEDEWTMVMPDRQPMAERCFRFNDRKFRIRATRSGSIPFSQPAAYQLSLFRISPQNPDPGEFWGESEWKMPPHFGQEVIARFIAARLLERGALEDPMPWEEEE